MLKIESFEAGSYANVYKTKEITLLNVQLVPCYTLHVYVC